MKVIEEKHRSECWVYVLGVVAILFYYIPYFVCGENMYITVHDNLDSTIAYLNELKNSGTLFDFNAPFPSMDGLNGANISFRFLPRLLLIEFLSPFTSYVVNEMIGRFVGFVGMYLLLSRYVLDYNKHRLYLSVLVSLCFSLMAYYSDYGLSVMGQPLLFYSFLNLREKRKLFISYVLILFVVLYSSLVLSGLFVGVSVFVYYLYIRFSNKKIYKDYLLGFILLIVIYIATNYSLFVDFLGGQIPSHRLDFRGGGTCFDALYGGLNMLFKTQYHTGSLPVFLIFIFACFSLFVYKNSNKKIVVVLLVVVGIICWSVVFNFLKILSPSSSILNAFQLDRFYFLLPVLWLCLFAILLQNLVNQKKGKIALHTFVAIFILGIFYLNVEYVYIVKRILLKKTDQIVNSQPTYKQFYDVSLFKEIDTFLQKDKSDFKIVCLGFYPSVASYNGFYTLDGYYQNYPLAYKHQFRNIMSQELSKSKQLQQYFDNWGSRCYLFSSELGTNYLWSKDQNKIVSNFQINVSALKSLGCSYLFSAVTIQNYKDLNLTFLKSFTTPKSYWNINIYQID